MADLDATGALTVIHLVPSIEEPASGLTTAVPPLCRALGAGGVACHLMSIGQTAFADSPGFVHSVFPAGAVASRLRRAPALVRQLEREAPGAGLIHSHSLWSMVNVAGERVARQRDIPLIFSPHGTLAETALAQRRAAKRAFWGLYHLRGLGDAACLHATSEAEYADLRRAGLVAPVAVIANGVDPPEGLVRRSGGRPGRVLFLARLHPVKGLETLIRAWAALDPRGWELRVVGTDNHGYQAGMEALARDLAAPEVVFAGPRYGAEVWAEYAAADLYVLPSRGENFGLTIAEALAAGTPVITTTATPWSDLGAQGAGWQIAPDQPALEQALAEAMALPSDTRDQMGARGRAWMQAAFGWARAAEKMAETYHWVRSGARRAAAPAFIRFD